MSSTQPGILAAVPPCGRFVTLSFKPGADPARALAVLSGVSVGKGMVVGVGSPWVVALGKELHGLRSFPALQGRAASIPSTQEALWMFLGGADAGGLLLEARSILVSLLPFFHVDEDVASFKYDVGRDLSGYEDGTENPKGPKAVEAAIVRDRGDGFDGSSFVAVQRWVHDLAVLGGMKPAQRDALIGRRGSTNAEIGGAPSSAHVKRAAQETFDPPAFMVRRSMPWGTLAEQGLYFVAYGETLDRFERVLARMAGLDDGVTDGLFRFTRPVTGGYYWCPPLRAGRLDLRILRGRLP